MGNIYFLYFMIINKTTWNNKNKDFNDLLEFLIFLKVMQLSYTVYNFFELQSERRTIVNGTRMFCF